MRKSIRNRIMPAKRWMPNRKLAATIDGEQLAGNWAAIPHSADGLGPGWLVSGRLDNTNPIATSLGRLWLTPVVLTTAHHATEYQYLAT